MQAKILGTGIDTLKVNVKLQDQAQELLDNVEVLCSLWQHQVREKLKPIASTISFHNARITMLPNGASAWKYIIRNDCHELKIGPRLYMPILAKATLTSAYLWEVGDIHQAVDEVNGFLR